MNRSITRFLAPLGMAGLLASTSLSSASAQSLPTWHWVSTDPQVINHGATASFYYTCPDGQNVAINGFGNDANVQNTSSPNVTMAHYLNTLDGSLSVSFTNWNLDGDQTYSFNVGCPGPAPDQTPPPADSVPQTPVPQPQPQPQQPPALGSAANDPLTASGFLDAYNALLQGLKPGQRTPGATLAGTDPFLTQTPQGVLRRLFAQPVVLNYMQSQTITLNCNGRIVADPLLRRGAPPYLPRASNVNVDSTIVSGGYNSSSISISFTNLAPIQAGPQIASFRIACLTPTAGN
jgi:hypothetical protein